MRAARRHTTRRRIFLASCAAFSLLALPAAANVGVATAVNVDAKARQPGGAPRLISLGQSVIFDEEIITDANGLVQILLLDGTTFTVGPNSSLTIDKFVYDPASGDAEVVASVTKGAFRFIGGQTSRKAGGATINTPVGTIGIRGAIVEGQVGSSTAGTFSMISGDEVTFTGRNRDASRIYRPGYTLVVSGNGGDATVRKRTKEDAAAFQQALTSQGNGSATSTPTNDTVAQSPLAEANKLPDTVTVLPSDSPVRATPITDAAENVGKATVTAGATVAEIIAAGIAASAPVPTPSPGSGSTDETVPDGSGPGPVVPAPKTRLARVLTANAGGYVADFDPDNPIPGAGARGLVGSTAQTDRRIVLTEQSGYLVSQAAGIYLPNIDAYGESFLETLQVDGVGDGRPVSGKAYAGRGDFAAYFLGFNGDVTQPFYTLLGTATPAATLDGFFTGTNIRQYALTQDPIRPSPAALFAPDLYGPITGSFSSTPLFIVESNTRGLHAAGETIYDTKAFLSWINISGTGTAQKSAILVFAPSIADYGAASPDVYLDTARRGTFRAGAYGAPVNMRGGVVTNVNADGASFFGPNADNFVIGTSIGHPDTMFDSLHQFDGGYDPNNGYLGSGDFSTRHVADLVATSSQAAFTRTQREIHGFMSGMGESTEEGLDNPYILRSSGGPNFYLERSPTYNSVAATGEVYDTENVAFASKMSLAFGYLPGSSDPLDGGDNTFVDDNRFGARNNLNRQNTRLLTDDSQDLPQVATESAGSYMVSGRANPIPGFQHCTACAFIDWGWWGTRVHTEPDDNGEPYDRFDYVHMGTWVAGDIANPVDLPVTGSATYAGTALANVSRVVAGDTAKYIASGDMNMSFDFSTRTGTMALSNLDGITASGNVAETSNANQALFGGALSGYDSSGYVSGSVNGAFVNNGGNIAAGVIGDFGLTTTGGSNIVGTIAGACTVGC